MKKKGLQKDDILDIAMQSFLEKGYSATSTSDICVAAEISKTTLYYYFHNKRYLFFSCRRDLRNQRRKGWEIGR